MAGSVFAKDYALSTQAYAEAIKSLPDAHDNTSPEYISIMVFAPNVYVISESVSETIMHTLRFRRTRFRVERQAWWDWVLMPEDKHE